MMKCLVRFGFGVAIALSIAAQAIANIEPYEAQIRHDVTMQVGDQTLTIPRGSRVLVIAEFFNGAEISHYQVIYQGTVFNVDVGKI